jgi:hypothetical protein
VRSAAAALAALALAAPTPQQLARRALAGDARALAQLRAVAHGALDARGAVLRARLRTLAAPASAVSTRGARADAARILSERRFRGSSVPRPFHGALAWLGRELRRAWSPFRRLERWLPGPTFWIVLGGIVVALAAWLARRLGQRRGAAALDRLAREREARGKSARELEREAAEAEARGELELALRLRFRAGLLRLARAEAIPARESLTNAQLRRLLDSAAFARLADDFDEVVYGERTPSPDDVERARTEWPRVLEEARR